MDGGIAVATYPNAVNKLFAEIVRRFGGRSPRAIDVVDQRPLFGGAVVHVVDVDGKRLVFAVTGGSIALLARYASPACDHLRREACATSSNATAMRELQERRP